MNHSSHPNKNVTCSQYGCDVKDRNEVLMGDSQQRNDPKRRTLETKVNLLGSVGYVLVLYDSSYGNYLAPQVVETLGIECVMRRDPYYQGRYLVDRSARVFFTHGNYQEDIWCDVLPLDDCHLCLGNP